MLFLWRLDKRIINGMFGMEPSTFVIVMRRGSLGRILPQRSYLVGSDLNQMHFSG